MIAISEAALSTIAVAVVSGSAVVIAAFVSARRGAQRGIAPVAEQLDTGNEKKLGQTVHELAQNVEIVATQAHANARDTVELGDRVEGKLDRIEDKVDRIDGRVDRVERKTEQVKDSLDGHIDDMASRVAEHDEMVRKQKESGG